MKTFRSDFLIDITDLQYLEENKERIFEVAKEASLREVLDLIMKDKDMRRHIFSFEPTLEGMLVKCKISVLDRRGD